MFSNEPRFIYSSNQLGEVICQLRFPDILSIETKLPADFQDAIRAEFPRCGFKFGRWLGIYWMEKRLKPVEIPSSSPVSWGHLRNNAQKFSDILAILSLS